MSKVVTVTNQKGGAGKTTTAAMLAGGLSLRGYKILLVDLDPQGNLTFSAKANKSGATTLGVITGEVKAREAIQHTESGDIIAGCKALSGADAFITDTGKEYKLREALEDIQGEYDYIIIDTPPSLGILTINALTASDEVIIPAQADIFSLQGMEQLAEITEPVKKYCNPKLKIAGVLLTRYNSRSVLSREIATLAGQIATILGTRLFKTTIRENVAVREAQYSQRPLYKYAPNANATADYTRFIKEYLGEEI